MNKLISEAEYALQAKRYFTWLASFLAVTLFSYSIGALQFEHPWRINLIGLPLWLCILGVVRQNFPSDGIALKELSGGDKESEAGKQWNELVTKYHGPKNNLPAIVAVMLAWAFYFLVLFSGMRFFACVRWLN